SSSNSVNAAAAWRSSTIGQDADSFGDPVNFPLRTQIIETRLDGSDDAAINKAAETIRAGRIVALPTSSGYVLAADPVNLNAIASVFRAKGRELHRALPILVDSLTMAEDYAADPL